MKINELIHELEEIKSRHGNLVVRYADDYYYPSEVDYAEYRPVSPSSPLGDESERLREYVLLI